MLTIPHRCTIFLVTSNCVPDSKPRRLGNFTTFGKRLQPKKIGEYRDILWGNSYLPAPPRAEAPGYEMEGPAGLTIPTEVC